MRYLDVRNAWIGNPSQLSDLKYCSELLVLIEAALDTLSGDGDLANRLGISEEILDDLVQGRVGRFKLTELESIARRAGIQWQ